MDLFDLYQQQQLRDHSRSLSRTAEDVSLNRRHTNDQVSITDARIDRLALLCEAMWDLISERTDLTTDDLRLRVEELDLLDGQRDGRRQKMPTACPCGAKVNPKAAVCQFCGAAAPERSAFDAV